MFSGPFLRARVTSLKADGSVFQSNTLSGELQIETWEDSSGYMKALICNEGLDFRCTIMDGGRLEIEAA